MNFYSKFPYNPYKTYKTTDRPTDSHSGERSGPIRSLGSHGAPYFTQKGPMGPPIIKIYWKKKPLPYTFYLLPYTYTVFRSKNTFKMRFFRKIQILIFEKVEKKISERTPAIFAQGANSSVAKDFQKKNIFLKIRFFFF